MPPNPFLLAADILDPPSSPDRDLAEACAASLSTFIREAWPIVEPATPFVSAWHIDVVAEHLEAVSSGEIRRLIINIPPRTMKSLSVAVFWPAWEWLRKPHLRWMFATYAQELTVRDSTRCRRVISSRGGREDGTIMQRAGYQGLLALLGESWSLTGDQNAKTKYETTRTGMRLATSVGGIATGEGGDRIVVDDPLNSKRARSDVERAEVNTWWDETMTTRFNNASAAAVIVMQRLHEADLTGHLLEKGGWHHLCLPASYEPSHPFVCPASFTMPSGRELGGDRRDTEGEQLDPVRLGTERLDELARDLGSYGYAGQMQQRPSPDEGGMFKRHWWGRWTAVMLPPKWQRVVQSWDMRFSDSQAQSSSYVVGQVWGINGPQRYLLGQVRARLSFTETVRALEATKQWWPETSAILVERKANGAAVMDTLKLKVGGLIAIEPEGGKDVRAAAVEPFAEAGDILVPAAEFIDAPPGYEPTQTGEWLDELSVFPNGAHDDQVDAFTQVLNWLANKHGKVGHVQYMDTEKPAVVRRGDLVLKGDQYVDKP